MKTTTILLLVIFLATSASFAQSGFETVNDPVTNQKMLIGSIHKKDIASDPDFNWYGESQKIYPTPDADAVKALRENKDKIYLVIFVGTWCEDTHFVLPRFFKIQEAADFPESHIAMFALDRDKKMPNPIAAALDVKDVPTIIVMKDGKEVGRVVEYGKTGYWDKELADVIQGN